MKISPDSSSLANATPSDRRNTVSARSQTAATSSDAQPSTVQPSVKVTLSPFSSSASTNATSDSDQSPLFSQLQGIMRALRQMGSGSAQRKAAARARVEQIKKQIESMQKFAVALTPQSAKAMAAQVRMLAQQLKAAAAELSGGGGSAVVVPEISINHAAGASDASPTVSASSDQVATPSAADDAASQAPTANDVPAATDSTKADDAAAVAAAKAAETEATAAAGKAEQQGDDPKAGTDTHKTQATGTTSSDESRADLATVRAVAEKLKQLLALIRMHLRDGRNADTKAVDRALHDIDEMKPEQAGGAAGGESAGVAAADGGAA
ncbi:hypothetical protein [Andreprevotia chitinilytica]|uniref:hypothetical protein n=1 Tax=Andreprevotia chitinilytica TaxID=396808 RepID=UPI0005587A32|nr:hypothetical protein [Andreprevotia chitinilytica]